MVREGGRDAAQPAGRRHHVVVGERQQAGLGLADAGVVRAGEPRRGQPQAANPREARPRLLDDARGLFAAALVDDQHVEVRVVLGDDAVQGRADRVGPVAGADHDRDSRKR
jgi:hypothetical protein